jgi:hypothetical protein
VSGNYHMTIEQVEELIMLKHRLDEVVERVMMSHCHRSCPYKECPLDTKQGEQLRTTPPAQNNGTGGNPVANMPVTSGVA